MKLLTSALSAATLLALAASASQAASHHHSRTYRGAYAYHGYGPVNASRVGSPAPIYRQGHSLGTDPDPRVRYQINRDPYDGRP